MRLAQQWIRRWCEATERLVRRCALLGLIGWTVCATLAAPPPARLPNGLETFDAAWDIINRTHYDTNFNGVNWQRVRNELRPKAQAARTPEELRSILETMVHRLGQSHFAIIPGGANYSESHSNGQNEGTNANFPLPPTLEERESATGDIGIELRLLKRDYVVSRVLPNSPAERAGVRLGWILQSIDGIETRAYGAGAKGYNKRQSVEIAWSAVCQRLKGPPGSRLKLVFRDGVQRLVPITCERTRIEGTATKLGFLPTFYARLEKTRLHPAPGVNAGLIRFNIWMPSISADLDQAIDELRGEDGMILDLRGNPGGQITMVMGLSGHFLGDEYSLGTLRTRDALLQLNANPRFVNAAGQSVRPFAGPLAILVDDCSFSASEIFAGGMQALGRARIFGQTSPGMALPATVDTLPNGDRLEHVFGNFVAPNGTRWEGRGVIPDTAVPLRRANLLAGRDAALEAAARWIVAQKRAGVPPNSLAAPAPSSKSPSSPKVALPAAAKTAPDASLPTPEAVIAKFVQASGGHEALDRHTSMHFEGSVLLPAQGFNGHTEILQARPNKNLTRISFKTKLLNLEVAQGFDGKVGWMIDPTAGPKVMKGNSLSQLADQADFEALFHNPKLYQSLEITGKELFEGKLCYKMQSVSHAGAKSTEFFDVQTGLMIGMISLQQTILGSIPATTVLSDYRRFDGLLVPTKYTIKCIGFEIITVIESLEFDKVEDSAFALPPQIEGLVK